MAIILKANKVNLFVSSVLFVFWYHSPNVLDTPHICDISRLRVKVAGKRSGVGSNLFLQTFCLTYCLLILIAKQGSIILLKRSYTVFHFRLFSPTRSELIPHRLTSRIPAVMLQPACSLINIYFNVKFLMP
jgi:hypothetical protein